MAHPESLGKWLGEFLGEKDDRIEFPSAKNGYRARMLALQEAATRELSVAYVASKRKEKKISIYSSEKHMIKTCNQKTVRPSTAFTSIPNESNQKQ